MSAQITRKLIIGKCDASIASSTKAKEKLLKWGINPNRIFISLLTVDVNKICMITVCYLTMMWNFIVKQ